MGFEPTVRCRTAVFKTASLNHSDISPCGHSRYAVSNAYLLYQICAVLSSPYANFSLKNSIVKCNNFLLIFLYILSHHNKAVNIHSFVGSLL